MRDHKTKLFKHCKVEIDNDSPSSNKSLKKTQDTFQQDEVRKNSTARKNGTLPGQSVLPDDSPHRNKCVLSNDKSSQFCCRNDQIAEGGSEQEDLRQMFAWLKSSPKNNSLNSIPMGMEKSSDSMLSGLETIGTFEIEQHRGIVMVQRSEETLGTLQSNLSCMTISTTENISTLSIDTDIS